MAVAVVERFKHESVYELSAGTKKGHCRELAFTGGSTVVKYVEKNLDITREWQNQGNGKTCLPSRGLVISGFLFIDNTITGVENKIVRHTEQILPIHWLSGISKFHCRNNHDGLFHILA